MFIKLMLFGVSRGSNHSILNMSGGKEFETVKNLKVLVLPLSRFFFFVSRRDIVNVLYTSNTVCIEETRFCFAYALFFFFFPPLGLYSGLSHWTVPLYPQALPSPVWRLCLVKFPRLGLNLPSSCLSSPEYWGYRYVLLCLSLVGFLECPFSCEPVHL